MLVAPLSWRQCSGRLQSGEHRLGVLLESVASVPYTPADLSPFGRRGRRVDGHRVGGADTVGGSIAVAALVVRILGVVAAAGGLGFLAVGGGAGGAGGSAANPGGHVAAPLVLLVGIRDLLADHDLVLDDDPRVEGFVPVQESSLLFLGDVQQNPPGHSDLVAGVDQRIVLVVGRLDEAAVEAVSRVVRADLCLADDHVVEPRAFDQDRLLLGQLLAATAAVCGATAAFEEPEGQLVVPEGMLLLLLLLLGKVVLLEVLLQLQKLPLLLILLLLLLVLILLSLLLLLLLLLLFFDVSSTSHPLRVVLAFQSHRVRQGY